MLNKYPFHSCREDQGSQYIPFFIKNADFVRSQYKTQTHMADFEFRIQDKPIFKWTSYLLQTLETLGNCISDNFQLCKHGQIVALQQP